MEDYGNSIIYKRAIKKMKSQLSFFRSCVVLSIKLYNCQEPCESQLQNSNLINSMDDDENITKILFQKFT